jgi:uncharacterized protein YxjI
MHMQSYVLRDKGLCATSGYLISDETDRPLYRADGKNWTLSREYTLKDTEGAELLHLKQKLFSLSKTYMIDRNGEHCATIRQSGRNFRIDMPGQSGFKVEKSWSGLEYKFMREGREFAVANPKPVSLTANCTVKIQTGEDTALVLASMVAIYDMKR